MTLLLGIPGSFALVTAEYDLAVDIFALVAIGIFVWTCCYLATHRIKIQINRIQSYIILVICWFVLPVIGSVPFFVFTDLPFVDIIFESYSGFTTTGATILADPAVINRPLLLWRSILQWSGGLFTLLSIVIILAPSGIGGLPNRFLKLINLSSVEGGRSIVRTIIEISRTYAVFTGICFVALIFTGLNILDAASLSLSTLSTGGFISHDGNIATYQNPVVELLLIVFMLIGGTSVLWHRMLLQGQKELLIEHRESYSIIITSILVGAVFALVFGSITGIANLVSFLSIAKDGLFTAVSLITTTGFSVQDDGFSVLPYSIILFVALLGGGLYSTAGGLKQYRLIGMFVYIRHELEGLIYPHGVRSLHQGGESYSNRTMKAVWSFFTVAILTVIAGSLILSLDMTSFDAALMASVASFSNIGPIYSQNWVDGSNFVWPEIWELSGLSKLAMCFIMVTGRLEVLVIFAALNRTFWTQSRHRKR